MPNNVFENLVARDHEQVIFCSDNSTGLKAIVAIHNTALGPALGGCRMWNYANEDEALKDVLRLSRGMTYKAAVAGLNLGGGKAVIIGDAKKLKSEALFRAFGRFVNGIAGRYITAEDVGTSVRDMEWVRMETPHVTGISRSLGGSGDPSPVTAFGVYQGMRAAAKVHLGKDSLAGLTVAIQGVGHVGAYLAKHLVQDGAKVVVTDIDTEAVKRLVNDLKVEGVGPDEIYDQKCDVFAPCALGGIVNTKTVSRLKCKVIAGAANNQLEDDDLIAPQLHEKGILYSPDYVINAGGLINVANELEGYNQERAMQQAGNIYNILMRVFQIASEQKVTTQQAAATLAMERVSNVGRLKHIFTGYPGGRIRGVS